VRPGRTSEDGCPAFAPRYGHDARSTAHTRRPSTLGRQKSLRGSRSAENLNTKAKEAAGSTSREKPVPYRLEHLRRSSNVRNDSVSSLPNVASAQPPLLAKRRERADSADLIESNSRSFALTADGANASITAVLTQSKAAIHDKGGSGLGQTLDSIITHSYSSPPDIEGGMLKMAIAQRTAAALSDKEETASNASSASEQGKPRRRAAPPPPAKHRRKPPAVPVGRTNGGATMEAIASSRTSTK
jgi:hypothetical protein